MAKLIGLKRAVMFQVLAVSIGVFFCSGKADAISSWIHEYHGPRCKKVGAVKQTADGGCLMAASFSAEQYYKEVFGVLKLDQHGRIKAKKFYINASGYSTVSCMCPTPDGGFVIVRQEGYGGIWSVLKIKSDLSIESKKTIPLRGRDSITNIAQTRDGGYIMVGSKHKLYPLDIESDAFVLKLKSNLTTDWGKIYDLRYQDKATCVAETEDGYIVGAETHERGARYDGPDAWVFKLNVNGELGPSGTWQKTFQLCSDSNQVTSVMQARDGEYYVAGYAHIWPTSGDFSIRNRYSWVVNLDTDGILDWARVYYGYYKTALFLREGAGRIIMGGYDFINQPQLDHAWVLYLNPEDGEVVKGSTYIGGDAITCADESGHVFAGTRSSTLMVIYPAPWGWSNVGGWCAIENKIWFVDSSSRSLDLDTTTITPTNARLGTSPSNEGFRVVDLDFTCHIVCRALDYAPPIPDGRQLMHRLRIGELYPLLSDLIPTTTPEFPPQRIPPGGGEYPPYCVYSFSEMSQPKTVPPYLYDIYRSISPLFGVGDFPKSREDSIQNVKAVLTKVPTGSYYNKKTKALVQKSLSKHKNTKEIAPAFLDQLAQAISAIELDLAEPPTSTVEVHEGKYSAVDFEGMAWAAFRDLKKSGKASLTIENSVPAPLPGLAPAWPIATYGFHFTGELSERGYIDLSFFVGGISFTGPISKLQILEWDGKSYTNITSSFDAKRKVITGRTKRLSKYVVMEPEP